MNHTPHGRPVTLKPASHGSGARELDMKSGMPKMDMPKPAPPMPRPMPMPMPMPAAAPMPAMPMKAMPPKRGK